ncbi:MAG: hypothetical protein AAFW00_10665 [Bacteroidota bacterium]
MALIWDIEESTEDSVDLSFLADQELDNIKEVNFFSIEIHFRGVEGKYYLLTATGPNSEYAERRIELPELEAISSQEPMGVIKKGQLLSNILFSGNIQFLFQNIYSHVFSERSSCIRLRLHFFSDFLALSQHPWEALELNGRPFLFNPRHSIVRTIDTLSPSRIKTDTFSKLLIISYNPNDKYDIPTEVQHIKDAVKNLIDQDLFQVNQLDNPTLDQITAELENDYSTIHLTGGSAIPEGEVEFHTKDGHTLFAKNLAPIFKAHQINTLVLNTPNYASKDLANFGKPGIAEEFLKRGIPRVITLYDKGVHLADSLYIKFAEAFYGELVRSNSIELAIFQSRKNLALSKTSPLTNTRVDDEENSYAGSTAWFSPIYFSRTTVDKFWTGSQGQQVMTFLREGKLITQQADASTSLIDSLTKSIEIATEHLDKIKNYPGSGADYMHIQNRIHNVRMQINANDLDNAINSLNEVHDEIHALIRKREEEETQNKAQYTVRRNILIIISVAFGIIGLISFLIGWFPQVGPMEAGESADSMRTIKLLIPVLGIPGAVVLWSIIGGIASMLREFVYFDPDQDPSYTYSKLVWRPLVGLVIGSGVYLVIAGGVDILGIKGAEDQVFDENPYLFMALAFIGGFSDKLSNAIFSRFVGKVISSEKDLDTTVKDSSRAKEKPQDT